MFLFDVVRKLNGCIQFSIMNEALQNILVMVTNRLEYCMFFTLAHHGVGMD